MSDRTILILGAGPGIGRCVASIFARKRYNNVVLIARRAEMLAIEKKAVEAAIGSRANVKAYAVDTTNTVDLIAALDDADATFGKPEVVFYNAARVMPSEFFVHSVEDIEYDLKVSCISFRPQTAPYPFPKLAGPSPNPAFPASRSLSAHCTSSRSGTSRTLSSWPRRTRRRSPRSL
jgi:NAD(P)-dependent dehydrogenase (short-subunit alcohol dehydrogenase family)